MLAGPRKPAGAARRRLDNPAVRIPHPACWMAAPSRCPAGPARPPGRSTGPRPSCYLEPMSNSGLSSTDPGPDDRAGSPTPAVGRGLPPHGGCRRLRRGRAARAARGGDRPDVTAEPAPRPSVITRLSDPQFAAVGPDCLVPRPATNHLGAGFRARTGCRRSCAGARRGDRHRHPSSALAVFEVASLTHCSKDRLAKAGLYARGGHSRVRHREPRRRTVSRSTATPIRKSAATAPSRRCPPTGPVRVRGRPRTRLPGRLALRVAPEKVGATPCYGRRPRQPR